MSMNALPSRTSTYRLSQVQPAMWLACYVEHRREELGMSVEFAARLAGLAESEWRALEAGWVPEDRENQWAIGAVLEVSTAEISFLAAISVYNQSIQN
jgi:hypothetical protein